MLVQKCTPKQYTTGKPGKPGGFGMLEWKANERLNLVVEFV